MAAPFRCPCLTCPRCGHEHDTEDRSHPEDGLAGPCEKCPYYEWWASCGEFMDGRHPQSVEELQVWNAYDDAIAREHR